MHRYNFIELEKAMALLLGGLGYTVGGIFNGVAGTTTLGSGSPGQVGGLINLDLGGLAQLGIGAGGTNSIIAVDGTIGASGSTAVSPIIDLGIDLGTGSTGGNGGLLAGLFGGATNTGGEPTVPGGSIGLGQTIINLTSALVGGTNGGTGTGGSPSYNPGSPGAVIDGTNAPETIYGTAGNDTIRGFGGNDAIVAQGGNDIIDGGAGIDTIGVSGTLRQYNAATENGVFAIQNKTTGEIDFTSNVERIYFSDNQVLALDYNGDAGQAFRLYQAALDRAPDAHGLAVHVHNLDGGTSLHDEALTFVNSVEFQHKYGANLTDQQYVTALYENTLNRAPDANGYAYWTGVLANHSEDRASVLVGFSESFENHQLTDHQLQNGILLDYNAV